MSWVYRGVGDLGEVVVLPIRRRQRRGELVAELDGYLGWIGAPQPDGRAKTVLGQALQALARLEGSRTTAVPTALDQLPTPVAGFTGRDDELAVLAGLLGP